SGKVLGLLGDYSSCENSYKQALEIMQSQSIENLLVPIQTEQGLGEALWLQGKKQEARKHLESVKSRLSKLELFQKPNNLQRINFTDKTPDQILVLIN
ncbi:MAG: tetratricopeptide repeat protein, partial [Blastocatellia bacterium]|nr:tetratricopeptide repeat protein [Blastocatellia bacterium]